MVEMAAPAVREELVEAVPEACLSACCSKAQSPLPTARRRSHQERQARRGRAESPERTTALQESLSQRSKSNRQFGKFSWGGRMLSESLIAEESQKDREALELFVLDEDGDFEYLESLVSQFNIFEAIGAVRQELRHSELLAFLLDPNENHGLGDSFLRRFLQKAIANATASTLPISPVDLDVWDLDDVDIRREWKNIDILILDARHRLAVIIENKIDSGEHSDQLARYWRIVEQEFSGYRIIGLFLTPERTNENRPTDSRYIAIDYVLVSDVVDRFLKSRSSTIGPDVQTVLRHYVEMLRRHIVSDPKIAELCQQLYRKHRRAFDLVFAHRPDTGGALARVVLENLIRERGDLVIDDSIKTYLRFAPKVWDRPKLRSGTGWTKTGRTLLFEIVFQADKIFLKLTLGPGPTEVRDAAFAEALARPDVFKSINTGSLSPKYHQLFQHSIVDWSMLASFDGEAIERMVKTQWEYFVKNDLPAILAVVDSVGALSA